MEINIDNEENRKAKIIEILMRKVKNNLDVLFDFNLRGKAFKETYGVTKKELSEVI
jgi:hypothetical protein